MRAYQSHNQNLIRIAKWILIPAIVVFIGYKLFEAYDIDTLLQSHQFHYDAMHLMLLVIVLILMPINILLESAKWHMLVMRYEQVSFKWAVQSVVSGLSLSIITPNQLGDFAGRVIKLKELNKLKGALVAVVGHTAQLFWVSAGGLLAFILKPELLSMQLSPKLLILLSYAMLIGAFMFFYFNMHRIAAIIKRPKVHFYAEVFGAYNRMELFRLLVISGLRYGIYTTQYLLLIYFFDTGLSVFDAIAAVSATLCAQMFMPSFLIVELGLRGASALWFLGRFSDNYVSILLSAYSLWIVNIMLPALYGLVVLSQTKVKVHDS